MFLIHGRRKIRVKKYSYHQAPCDNCKALDIEVEVYKEYFHIFFIPVFPVMEKSTKMRCNNCGQVIRISAVEKHFEGITRNPIYLYSGLILVAGLIVTAIFTIRHTQNEEAAFIASPKIDDVYLMYSKEKTKTPYYFLQVSRINGDSVAVKHNKMMYSSFVSKFDNKDYFMEYEEIVFTKQALKKMLDDDEIRSVKRDYNSSTGFFRSE
jgi:zinc-ribbon family